MVHLALLAISVFAGAAPQTPQAVIEPLLREPPVGVRVVRSVAVGADDLARFGARLGGAVSRASNSVVAVHGASIRLNVIECASADDGDDVFASLVKLKGAPPEGAPMVVRLADRRTIVEYVGDASAAPVAWKASWELGFVEKPESLTYDVKAELATVDGGDDMACNPLFQAFLAWKGPGDAEGRARIDELAARLRFGSTLRLRSAGTCAYGLEPAPAQPPSVPTGGRWTNEFEDLPRRAGVPYVTVSATVNVDRTGLLRAPMPAETLVAATPRWPADDEHVRALAGRIVGDAQGADARVGRLLGWLTPGRNLKYEGQTGSRWGTAKVLQQGYGHCWDFSDAFVTLARAAGVPARQVAGWLYGVSGHVWAEYWSAERGGWQQVDPTGGGLLEVGLYHVPYFTTEDGEMPIVYLSMPRVEHR